MDATPLRPSRIVTVLGMHRSGTSALTRILDLLGATLGPPDALIPPAPDNPRGFWENRPLVLVNDRILALHGGSWAAPPDLPAGWHERPTMRALHAAAGEVFDRLVAEPGQVVAWKDPRSCLLQDFWQPLLAQRTDDLRHVHVLRSPDAVVGSLVRRNGLTPEHAARLWVRYVTDALGPRRERSCSTSRRCTPTSRCRHDPGRRGRAAHSHQAAPGMPSSTSSIRTCDTAAAIARRTARGSGAHAPCTKASWPVRAPTSSSSDSGRPPRPGPRPPTRLSRSWVLVPSPPRSSAPGRRRGPGWHPSSLRVPRSGTRWAQTRGPSSNSTLRRWWVSSGPSASCARTTRSSSPP